MAAASKAMDMDPAVNSSQSRGSMALDAVMPLKTVSKSPPPGQPIVVAFNQASSESAPLPLQQQPNPAWNLDGTAHSRMHRFTQEFGRYRQDSAALRSHRDASEDGSGSALIPKCGSSLLPILDEHQSRRKYSQHSEEAEPVSPPMCSGGVGNLQQEQDGSPQPLESSQSSFPLYARYTPERPLDSLPLKYTSKGGIKQGNTDGEFLDLVTEPALHVSLSFEPGVGPQSVNEDPQTDITALFGRQANRRHQHGKVPWNTDASEAARLTAHNVAVSCLANPPLMAQEGLGAGSFSQGFLEHFDPSSAFYCEPQRMGTVSMPNERVLADHEDWKLLEEGVRRWKVGLLRQRLLEEELQLYNELRRTQMTLLLQVRRQKKALHLELELQRKEAATAKAIDIMHWLANVQPPDVVDADAQVASDRERQFTPPNDDEARFTPVPPPRRRRSEKPSATEQQSSGVVGHEFEQERSQLSNSRSQASRDYVL
ncbi:uncharacterized protein LOC144123401 [Amblyomma americanum]